LLTFSVTASAHNKEAVGFISGFTHPLFGPDHLLAMLGVGLISARIAGHYIWSVPALFVTFMVIGGVFGVNGFELPLVEWGIAVSVIVLGVANLLVRSTTRLLLAMVMSGVAFFGLLHGYAHGAEMPQSISPLFYSVGFITSTTLIHLCGVYIGHVSCKLDRLAKVPSYLGGVMTLAGCVILFGLIK
jgi:urease accessory protein